MPFVRPTLAQLIARAKADVETRLPGADARLRRSIEAVLARMSSGGAHGLHGHLVWLSRQLFPDTAESEFLVRWADIWGLGKISAVKAAGPHTITGVDTSVCPATTLWQTGDDTPIIYEQDADVTIVGGTATAAVTADEAGADGNQDVGVTLSLVSPVVGIDTDGTVSGTGLTDGLDTETDAALLVRLLSRLRTPPKGGGPGDYENWALEVAGCTRAWQLANANGAGTVALYFVQDGDLVDIIPSTGEIATMQTALEESAPVTADVTAYGPTEDTFTMSLTLVPNTGTVQTAVEAETEDLILRIGDPSEITSLLLSQLDEAISIAPGETDHTITLINGGVPADISHAVGHIPKRGTITYS